MVFEVCPVRIPSNISPPPLPDDAYRTLSSALAAALIAAQQLEYSHCVLHPNGKDTVYVFHDPTHAGDELARRYTAGALPLVHAKMLADARSYLVDESKRVREGVHAKTR